MHYLKIDSVINRKEVDLNIKHRKLVKTNLRRYVF